MINNFLNLAKNDLPVYISDVRNAFQSSEGTPFHIHVVQYDNNIKVFSLTLPEANNIEEFSFIESYINANIYNILSSLGAEEIRIYLDMSNVQSLKLAESLSNTFQTDFTKSNRYGYGKCLNVNERALSIIKGKNSKFDFVIRSIQEEPIVSSDDSAVCCSSVFSALPSVVSDKILLGIDVGGTDIKLAVSVNGHLVFCKEYDWFPSEFENADQFVDPILTLTRLMRVCSSASLLEHLDDFDLPSIMRTNDLEEMVHLCDEGEKLLGRNVVNFDAIGLSFPDVIINNLIVGGETYKTRGIRNNKSLDYENEFKKITYLGDRLKEYTVPGGKVEITNDGPMAAFTVAVELASVGENILNGVFAHTLGTELGTGWVLGNGSIPEIPLEVYNYIIDLGSFFQRQYRPDDVRSINNFNTQLPGTLQKYTSQYGVFRLASKYLPEKNPQLFEKIISDGFITVDDYSQLLVLSPSDMRKPYLEFIMKNATDGDAVCSEIFRLIGEYLAVTWEETQYILNPSAVDRTLFGRLVKNQRCFELICEGATRRCHNLKQYAANGDIANTTLMKELEKHPDYTVAQFAQAVGALYYSCINIT